MYGVKKQYGLWIVYVFFIVLQSVARCHAVVCKAEGLTQMK